MSTGPQPIAEGSLADTPFAHVLVSVERRGLSGTLAVWPDDETRGQDRLLCDGGRVVAARLLAPARTLEAGLLPLFRRAAAPYAFYPENLLGDASGLVTGDVHTGALIAAALREGAREDIVERILAGHRGQPLRVIPGADLASLALLPKERAVIELLQAAPAAAERVVATSGDPAVARRVLYLLTLTRRLELHPSAARPPAASQAPEPGSPAGRFTAVPAAPPPAAAQPPAARASHVPAEPAARASHVSAGPAARVTPTASPAASMPGRDAPARPSVPAAAVGVPAPPPPPVGLSPELRARWQEVAGFIVAADDQNHFQVLGVGEAATDEEIAAAFAQRAKLLHPDRLGPDLAPLGPHCQRVFQQLSEAKKALNDPDARLAHVRAIRSGGGTPAHDRRLSAIVSAAMDFQKVDVLIKQRKHDEALALLDRVLAVEPDEPDYLARKAWTLFLVHPEKTGPRAAEILALADKALAKNDRHEQAHFTKASMLKRQGQMPAALDHFRQVLKANPKNLDAAREVRLADMRRKSGVSAPPGAKSGGESSLLKKLFGGGDKK